MYSTRCPARWAAVCTAFPCRAFRFDPITHNPIQDVYICKCAELEGGWISNKVIATFRDVRDPGSKQY